MNKEQEKKNIETKEKKIKKKTRETPRSGSNAKSSKKSIKKPDYSQVICYCCNKKGHYTREYSRS